MLRTLPLVFVALAVVPSMSWAQGDPLGPEFRVNTFTAGDEGYSAVAAARDNFVVVWESMAIDGGFGISGQRYDSAGNALGPEFRVNTYITGAQRSPAVGANASGAFVVVWESFGQDGSQTGVFGQRFSVSGDPVGPEFRVNTTVAGYQRDPAVAVAPSGAFLVAWSDAQGFAPPLPGDVVAQRYDSSGMPQGPEFRVNAYIPNSQLEVSVAAGTANDFVVVWTSEFQDGDQMGIFGQRYASSGTPLGPEFGVNTYTTYKQTTPAVATDPSGNFVVVWASMYQEAGFPGQFGVFGQRYSSSGVPVGPEFHVNTYTTGHQRNPVVATDGAGHFVVVWFDEVQDGSGSGVFGQRYSSTGAPSGPEFRVNTSTTLSQRAPAVASDAAGIFLVTWHSDVRDVYGQRFGGIFPVELMHFRVE